MYAKATVFLNGPSRSGRRSRTAARLRHAFKAALATKLASDITMVMMAEDVGVARSTVYRIYATPVEILWEIAWPMLDAAFRHAVRGARADFVTAFGSLWSVPGLVPALADPRIASDIRAKLSALASARLERRTRERDFAVCGSLIAASCLALISSQAALPHADEAALSELMSVVYIAAFLTPEGVEAMAREQAKALAGKGLPPAVSVAESVASDDYILSMIDGRPYRSLKRHLARYNLTADEYRQAFMLPDDYPMVARSYSETRSRLARAQIDRRKTQDLRLPLRGA